MHTENDPSVERTYAAFAADAPLSDLIALRERFEHALDENVHFSKNFRHDRFVGRRQTRYHAAVYGCRSISIKKRRMTRYSRAVDQIGNRIANGAANMILSIIKLHAYITVDNKIRS